MWKNSNRNDSIIFFFQCYSRTTNTFIAVAVSLDARLDSWHVPSIDKLQRKNERTNKNSNKNKRKWILDTMKWFCRMRAFNTRKEKMKTVRHLRCNEHWTTSLHSTLCCLIAQRLLESSNTNTFVAQLLVLICVWVCLCWVNVDRWIAAAAATISYSDSSCACVWYKVLDFVSPPFVFAWFPHGMFLTFGIIL